MAKFVSLAAIGAVLIFASSAHAQDATSTETIGQKQQALEDQLSQLQGQIDQYQNQITQDQAKGSSLSGEISELNADIAKVNLQIQATELTIQNIDTQITGTQTQISVTQAAIAEKKTAVGSLLNTLYQTDQTSLVVGFLEDPELSDLWDDAKDISLFENDLGADVTQLNTLSGQLTDQSQQLAVSQADAASAAAYETAEEQQTAATKSQESELLTETKGDESTYQTLVVQTQATAAQIRNQIFQLLGGGSLTFEQAYQYAQVASQATGVDPAFILAILDRESALGENVGQCSYQSAMNPSEIPVFLQIVQQLGLNANDLMVSCANSDGAYGGAMGPAQFEPSTWELYASAVSAITNDKPPSPWSNADAFVATALYLKDGLTGCEADYTAVLDQERCTAAKYYAGSDWQNYLWTYGEAAVEQAQTFTKDIATITTS
jgi:peptidoglycan hydrolase CwlO-like protein